MSTEVHDNLIRAFQEYFKNQDKFEFEGNEEAGSRARHWLSEIHKLAKIRRQEIQDKRHTYKAAREGKPGRPTRQLVKEMLKK